jgi:hypothetical protein
LLRMGSRIFVVGNSLDAYTPLWYRASWLPPFVSVIPIRFYRTLFSVREPIKLQVKVADVSDAAEINRLPPWARTLSPREKSRTASAPVRLQTNSGRPVSGFVCRMAARLPRRYMQLVADGLRQCATPLVPSRKWVLIFWQALKAAMATGRKHHPSGRAPPRPHRRRRREHPSKQRGARLRPGCRRAPTG